MLNNRILEFLISLIPLSYGTFLYIRVFQITKKSTEQELVEMDKKLSHMKRSALMFFAIGAYFMYQFYNSYYG